MLTLSNVRKRDHPLTLREEYIHDIPKEGIISVFVLLAVSIRYAQKTSITELVGLFTACNFVTVGLFFWLLYLFGKFLCGCLYIKRLNQAVQNGICFDGIITEHRKKMRGWRGFRYAIHQFGVQLDNGEMVDTPIYKKISRDYQTCRVYLHKKKYYFMDFRGIEPKLLSDADFGIDKPSEIA